MELVTSCNALVIVTAVFCVVPVADPFFFSSGNPEGLIATLSRTARPGELETETVDDFITTTTTLITNATFTGLLVGGATPSNVNDVEIELYHVFPIDSTTPPYGRVITHSNSPSDDNVAAADGPLGQLIFTTKLLSNSLTADSSVVNGTNSVRSPTSDPVERV